MNALMGSLVLFSTVVVSVGLGIVAANFAVNGILDLLGHRPQHPTGQVLVPSQAPVSGD